MVAFLAVRDTLVCAYSSYLLPHRTDFLAPYDDELRFCELYRGLVGVVMINL